MNRKRSIPSLVLCSVLLTNSLLIAEVDFVKEIQPIFKERCYECHGDDTREAGLRLDQKTPALAGGDSGLVINPGDAAASLLIKLVSGEDADRLMPPDGENLTDAEVEKLKTWIDEGAHWPEGVDPKAKKSSHWAYQPLNYELPDAFVGSELSPIDQFILAGLKKKQISPSPVADKYTLIKRLYYDLLGLPPSVEAVNAYINDNREDAYEHLVDDLLKSPHFGERWGRHWLDMARYADSDGYEKDRPRYNAWKYRDWVIQAINNDMPFDQFTIEQIAGDQLEKPTPDQLLATAFHRQTLTNTEGGTDQEEFRVAAVFDRVETIGAVWLGLTVGCARCHSHKYDQISQREYYQLFAFFNNGDETTAKVPSSESAQQKYLVEKAAFDKKLKQLQAPVNKRRAELQPDFEQWLARLEAEHRSTGFEQQTVSLEVEDLVSTGGGTLKLDDKGVVVASGDQAVQDVYEIKYRLQGDQNFEITGVRLKTLTDASLPKNGPGRSSGGNFVLSEITLDTISADGTVKRNPFATASADFSQKDYSASLAIDGKETTKGWAISPQMGKPHVATFQLKQPISQADILDGQLLIRLSQQYSSSLHTIGKFQLEFLSSAGSELADIPEDVRQALKAMPEKRTKEQKQLLFDHFAKQDVEFQRLNKALMAHQKQAPFNPEMVVRVIQTRRNTPRSTHVLKRGDFLQPLGPVQPQVLEVLPELNSATDQEGATRLDFAHWLVSGENPLTPRVAANHIWSHLFGTGIVSTVNDFGVRGEVPTHPELLDWLATQLVESGWSRKALIKKIVLSQAYQRSSVHRRELAEIDPTNQSLYRQNRFRVEAEIIRDLYLAASGLLEPRVGGPSVFPSLPADVASLSYANNFKWGNSDWNSRPDRPGGVAPKDDLYRRGMYTFFKRTAAHPNLVTFDCPDSNTTCVERGTSNTPLQALQTLNNDTFVEASRALAQRIQNESSLTSDADGLATMFRLCAIRPASSVEQTILTELLHDARSHFEKYPDEAVKLSGIEVKSGGVEAAAWVTVARTTLNLDEFIMRE